MNKRHRKKLEAKKKLKLPNVPHFTSAERWNLFHTFSVYIAAGLKDFLSHKIYGMPQEFLDLEDEMAEGSSEIEESKKFYEELSHEIKDMIAEREQVPRLDDTDKQSSGMSTWRETIEKMLWSFEQLRDGYPDSPYKKHAFNFNGEETPQEIWDANKIYYQKIQEGIDLFAKYFRNLWS